MSADSADATTAATTAVGMAGGELPVAYEWLITRLCSPMCPFEDVRGAFRDTAVGLQTTAAMRRQTVSRFCSVPLHPVARMLAADADRRAQRAAAKLARRAVVNPAAVVTGNEEGAGRDEEGSDRKELSPGDTLGLESLRVSATGAVAADPAATSVDSLVTAAAATTSAPTSPPAQHDDLLLSASDSDSDGEDAPTCTFLVQERVRQFVKSCKNGYPGAAWTKLDAMFGMHPRYFESELTTYRRLMTESGPLPATWRHYIAIMAASRYNCHYLVYAGRRRFLATGGDSDWLEGLHRAPPKLARLADLNGVLAHRPWLLGAEESNGAPTGEIVYRNEVAALLSGKNSYSKNELAHAIAVLATYHAQASFCHAIGIEMEPEDEFDVRGCGDGEDLDAADAADVADADVEDGSGDVAAVAKAAALDGETLHDSEIRNRLLRDEDPEDLFGAGDMGEDDEEEGDDEENGAGGSDKHDAMMMKHFSKIDVVSAGALSTAREASLGGAAPRPGEGEFLAAGAAAGAAATGAAALRSFSSKSAFSCSIYCGENTLEYQDFEVGTRAYRTLRTQEYSWGEHGFALMDRYSSTPGASAAEQFDQQFNLTYDLTYQTFSGTKDIDTLPFRRAIWYYVLRLFGICHDDYEVSSACRLGRSLLCAVVVCAVAEVLFCCFVVLPVFSWVFFDV